MKFFILIQMVLVSSLCFATDIAQPTELSGDNKEDTKVKIKNYSKELDDLLARQKVADAKRKLLETQQAIEELGGEKQPKPKSSNKKATNKTYVFKPNLKVYAIFDQAATVSVDGKKETVKAGEVLNGYEIVSVQSDAVLFKRLKTSKQYSIIF